MTTPNFTPYVPQWCWNAAEEIEEGSQQWFKDHAAAIIAKHAPKDPADALTQSIDAHPVCRGCNQPLKAGNAWMSDGCPCNNPRGINHGLVPKECCTCDECSQQQKTGCERFYAERIDIDDEGDAHANGGMMVVTAADHDAAIAAKDATIAELRKLLKEYQTGAKVEADLGDEARAEVVSLRTRAEAAEAKCAELELSVKSMKGHVSNVEATNEEQGEQLLAKIDQLAAANERIEELEAKLHSKTYVPCECAELRERVAALEKERDGLREVLRKLVSAADEYQCCFSADSEGRNGADSQAKLLHATMELAQAVLAKPSAEVGE